MFHTLSELNEKEKNKGKQNQKKNSFNMSKGKSPEDNYYGKGNKAYDHYNKRPSESLNVKFEKTKNKITLIVFQNGFILNNGPFRDRAIPENNQFMEEVERGNIPHELMDKGINDLGILLINRKSEIYHQPIPITQITQITQINPITINPYNQISSFDFGQLNQLSQLGKINSVNPINKTTNLDNLFNYNYSNNTYPYNNAYNNYTVSNNYSYNNNYVYNDNNNTYKNNTDIFGVNNSNYPYNNPGNYSLNNNIYPPKTNNISYSYNTIDSYTPKNNNFSYSYNNINNYSLSSNNNSNYSYNTNYPKQYSSKTQNKNQFSEYQFKDPLFLNIESLGYTTQNIPPQTPMGTRNVRREIFAPNSAYTDNRNYNRYERHTSSVPKKDMKNKFETFHNFKRLELIKEEEKKKENKKNKKEQNEKVEEKKEEKDEKGFTAFGGVGQAIGFVNTQGLNVQKDLKNSIDIFKPVCTINIRLFNGEIVKGQFNYSQTLRNIYYFVQKISGSNNFTLLDGFPPQPLRNYDMTIGQLKLENTTLTQRIN